MRIHPAVIAQAAATAAVQCEGRFTLGVGTGEALNEHIFGDAWPAADVRLAMLEEAVEVIRALHRGGPSTTRASTTPWTTPEIYTRPDAAGADLRVRVRPEGGLAGRPDRRRVRRVQPDAELIKTFRESGGDGRPTQGGLKVC